MNRLLTAAAVVAFAGVAHAGLDLSLEWREIDNTGVDPTGDSAAAIWNSQPGWRTFDLYVLGAEGTRINGVSLGVSSDPELDPYALYTDGTIFNYPPPGGGNLQSGFEGFPGFQLLPFDTYVDLGNLNANGGNQAQIGVADLDLTGTAGGDGAIRGAWFANPPAEGFIDASGEFRIMRVTVSSDALYLGTPDDPHLNGMPVSSLQLGLATGELALVIPDAILIPAPSALALFGAAGLAGIRRRR